MRTIALFALCLAGWSLAPSPLLAQDATIPSRLSLVDALRLVEQRDPALAAVRGQVSVATAEAKTALQRPNPVLGFSSEGYRPWAGGGRSPNEQETVIAISQEIETGGRRRLRGAAAAAAVGAARASANEGLRRLRLETQQAYFQLVLARLEVETTGTALAEVDKVIAVNRARYKQGEVSGGELRRLEVERMKFTDDVLAAKLAEQNARGSLLALLGAPRLDAALEPTDALALVASAAATSTGQAGVAQAGAAFDPASLQARALAARPDLAAVRHEEERAQNELQLQQALRVPTLTVGGGYRRDFGENGLVVTASIPLPLFNRNAGAVARAEAQRRLAGTQTRQAERTVSLEVQQAVNTVEAARARLSALESEYLEKAREARDSALAAYRSGASDLIDYLDAQRAYRDVQRAYQRALFDHRMSQFQLDAAVGALSGDVLP